jgi:hypothetical protein
MLHHTLNFRVLILCRFKSLLEVLDVLVLSDKELSHRKLVFFKLFQLLVVLVLQLLFFLLQSCDSTLQVICKKLKLVLNRNVSTDICLVLHQLLLQGYIVLHGIH